MYLKAITATNSRRTPRAIAAGEEKEFRIAMRTSGEHSIACNDLARLVEVLKRYPHPDDSPELDDPNQLRAIADFSSDVVRPALVFGYGAKRFNTKTWRPAFKIPLPLATSLSPEDLSAAVRAKEREWLASSDAELPAIARG